MYEWYGKFLKRLILVILFIGIVIGALFMYFYHFVAMADERYSLRYDFDEKEVYLLAQLVNGECIINENNLDLKEVYKVLCVVMNRQRSSKFPNYVRSIVFAPGQFHVVPYVMKRNPSRFLLSIVREWCYAYDVGDSSIQVIPENHLYFHGDGRRNHTRARY